MAINNEISRHFPFKQTQWYNNIFFGPHTRGLDAKKGAQERTFNGVVASKRSRSGSAGEARKLIQANGIKLNGESISDVGRDLTFEDALFERFYLLRKGKKNYHLIARPR